MEPSTPKNKKLEAKSSSVGEKFSRIKDSTFCPFAKKSDMEYGDNWVDEINFDDNVQSIAQKLISFTDRFDKEKQDGIVFEISGKDCPRNIAELSTILKKILVKLNEHDPMKSNCLAQDIGGEDWQFEFNGKRLFLIAFAPFYPDNSPRQSLDSNTTYFFFQPELAFDKVFPETVDTPRVIKIKDGIRESFKAGGKPYDITIVDRPSDALKYIKPMNIGDSPVEWWK